MDELRSNVCEAVTGAFDDRGGKEAKVSGLVDKAVSDVESEAGLEKLGEILSRSERVKPWYKCWCVLGLVVVLLLTMGWFFWVVNFGQKGAASSARINKSLGFLDKLNLERDGYEFNDEEKWLLSGDEFEAIEF